MTWQVSTRPRAVRGPVARWIWILRGRRGTGHGTRSRPATAYGPSSGGHVARSAALSQKVSICGGSAATTSPRPRNWFPCTHWESPPTTPVPGTLIGATRGTMDRAGGESGAAHSKGGPVSEATPAVPVPVCGARGRLVQGRRWVRAAPPTESHHPIDTIPR